MEIIYTCSGEDGEKCGERSVGITGYGIRGGKLYHSALPHRPFAAMCIDARSYIGDGVHRILASEVIREAMVRDCGSILLDMPHSPAAGAVGFCRVLCRAGEMNGITVYLPERTAAAVNGAGAIIRTALCAGDLRERLGQAAKRYRRVSLDAEIMRGEFTLPAPSGRGVRLTADALTAALGGGGRFYSGSLMTNYALRGGCTRLILYDDAASVEAKLALAGSLGFAAAFVDLSAWNELKK